MFETRQSFCRPSSLKNRQEISFGFRSLMIKKLQMLEDNRLKTANLKQTQGALIFPVSLHNAPPRIKMGCLGNLFGKKFLCVEEEQSDQHQISGELQGFKHDVEKKFLVKSSIRNWSTMQIDSTGRSSADRAGDCQFVSFRRWGLCTNMEMSSSLHHQKQPQTTSWVGTFSDLQDL